MLLVWTRPAIFIPDRTTKLVMGRPNMWDALIPVELCFRNIYYLEDLLKKGFSSKIVTTSTRWNFLSKTITFVSVRKTEIWCWCNYLCCLQSTCFASLHKVAILVNQNLADDMLEFKTPVHLCLRGGRSRKESASRNDDSFAMFKLKSEKIKDVLYLKLSLN